MLAFLAVWYAYVDVVTLVIYQSTSDDTVKIYENTASTFHIAVH